MASETITIVRADVTAEVSRALIGSLNDELRGVYSEPGATHFRLDPEEVSGGRGAFLIVYGEYCLSPETSVCLGKDLLEPVARA